MFVKTFLYFHSTLIFLTYNFSPYCVVIHFRRKMSLFPISNDNISLSSLFNKMDEDIELGNLGDRALEEEAEEEETNIDTDWRDKSVVIIGGFNPEIREGLDEEKNADRELGKKLGAMRRSYTEDKKNLLREMRININKGDGPSAKTVFEKLKVTVNRKGKMNGAQFDGVRIIVQKGKN